MPHWIDYLIGAAVGLLGFIYKGIDKRVAILEEARLHTLEVLTRVEEQSRSNGEVLRDLKRYFNRREE
jgi:hypothetical protein